MSQADEDSKHRESVESIKQGRPVQRAAERLARDADRMEQESAELGQQIEQARADWSRKRTASEVPGASSSEADEGGREESEVTSGDGEDGPPEDR
jgi:hypothetical protein